MKDELHRLLDGEAPAAGLSDEARREAESWDRLLAAFRVEAPPASAPPWLESRIMAEIESLPEPGLPGRIRNWLLSPRPVRVSPLTVGLAAAGLTAILLVGRGEPGAWPLPAGGGGSAALASGGGGDPAASVVYVQFALEAPGASSVAVTGDFDAWEGSHALEDLDGDGVWSGRVPVRPGVHAYMFVVDGSSWRTDPRAERYADDGFGNRNAILAVAAPTI